MAILTSRRVLQLTPITMFLICLNLKVELSFTISNFNQEILNPFSHCAIHILTYHRVNYLHPSSPVVLTFYSANHPINVTIMPCFNVNYNCFIHIYVEPNVTQLVPLRSDHAFSRMNFWYQNQASGWDGSNSCPAICSYKNGMFSTYTGQYSMLVLRGADPSRFPLKTMDAWLEIVRRTTNRLITDKFVFFLGNQTSNVSSAEELLPIYQKYFVCDIYDYYFNASIELRWKQLASIDFKVIGDCKLSMARETS